MTATAHPGVNGRFPATSSREAFRIYLERGIRTVPIAHRSKNPGTLHDAWQELRLTPDDRDAEFPEGEERNIGALLGEPSGGIVDVDLDSTEARVVGHYLLPQTGMVSGRKTACRSHYWYRVDQPPKKASDKFFDPVEPVPGGGEGEHGALLLELRSTGGQTVVPPSLHPGGESYTWDKFDEPADVGVAELRRAVGMVAAAALLVRHWPRKGQRHYLLVALCGGMLRGGYTVEEVERLVRAVCLATGGDVKNEVPAVRDTKAKLDADGHVVGWPKVAELVGDIVVTTMRKWLGIRSSRETAPAGKPVVRRVEPFRPFPVEVLPQPLREFVAQCAAAKVCEPSFVALPVLAVVASAIGNSRALRLKHGWTEPSIVWSVVCADSGTLKSPAFFDAVSPLRQLQKKLTEEYQEAIARYEEEMDAWKAEKRKKDGEPGERPVKPIRKKVYCSDLTIEALCEILEDNPRGTLVARDELAAWLGSFSRYKGKAGGTDLPHWLELHRCGTVVVDRKTGERRSIFVPRASASITGGIQPGVLSRILTAEFLDAGLAARLLLAMPPKVKKQWSETEVAEQVEADYQSLLDRLLALDLDVKDGEAVPHVLRLSPEGKAAWVAFYGEWAEAQAAAEGEVAAALSKLEAYAARFALIHHVVTHVALETSDLRPVGPCSVHAGVALCRWFAYEARRVYSILHESDEARDARRMVEFIQARGGRITARELQRSNQRKYQDADQARAALELLVSAGLGHWTQPESGPKGGNPIVWFVLHEPCVTCDTTDTTTDDADDGDGFGARHNPPSPEEDPQNSQPSESCVGCVTRHTQNQKHVEGVESEEAGGDVLSPRPGVVSHTPSEGPGFVLVTDPADLPMVTTAVEETALVGLDTETTGLDPRADQVRLLSLCCDNIDGGATVYVLDLLTLPHGSLTSLWDVLRERPVVGHNLAYDLRFLARLGYEPGECRDTMLMSQVLQAGDRTMGHKLAECCQRELGEAIAKDEQVSDWSGVLTADQLRYAALDAELTRRLHDALTPKLTEAGLTNTAALEHRAVPAVAWMSAAGVGFDRDGWVALASEAEAEADRLTVELDGIAPARPQGEMFGSGWKWNSPAHVAEALRAVGQAVEDTDDNTLAAIDHPLAALLRDYRAAKKRAGTYGHKWLKHVSGDGRVYAGWRQIGADSGRMSCSAPNLQNLPRDTRYRRCFTAPSGRVLVKADYSQIELRIAAKVADERSMLDAYARGEDLHVLTARRLLGKPDVSKADRQLAKSVNFGLLYGMGARAFRVYARSNYGVELTEAEATAYRAKFFDAYPGLRKWHAQAGRSNDQAIETRTVANRRRLNVSRFTEKLNTPVQGTGADGLKAALGLLWDRRSECPGAVPVLAVHDEIVVECDADQADAVSTWLKQAMLDGMAPLVAPVPVEVEVSAARTWGGDVPETDETPPAPGENFLIDLVGAIRSGEFDRLAEEARRKGKGG